MACALYDDAQSAVKGWIAEIQIMEDRPLLIRAENLAAQGSLSAAIDIAAQIGPDRALYAEARTSICHLGPRAGVYLVVAGTPRLAALATAMKAAV